MKILAISGHAQNGKDTVANLLRDNLKSDGNRVLVTHYADLLKYMCRTFFDWDGKKDDPGRSLLQQVGTNIVGAKQPDFWVDFIISVLNLFEGSWDIVIIPDCRFVNEVEKMKNHFDTTLIRVVRPDFDNGLSDEQKQHPSETALDNYAFDYIVQNTGTLEELKTALSRIHWRIKHE